VPDLGKKYTCYSCHTKFYDLGKAVPICPKCGADQRDAEEAPAATSSRGRGASRAAPVPVVVEEPIEEDFSADAETPVAAEGEEDEELIVEPEREEEEAEEEDDGDEY
jgi:uncharacterized protein (TIGR02300 family)